MHNLAFSLYYGSSCAISGTLTETFCVYFIRHINAQCHTPIILLCAKRADPWMANCMVERSNKGRWNFGCAILTYRRSRLTPARMPRIAQSRKTSARERGGKNLMYTRETYARDNEYAQACSAHIERRTIPQPLSCMENERIKILRENSTELQALILLNCECWNKFTCKP